MSTTPRIRVAGLHKRYPRNRDLLRFLRAPLRREYTTALRGVDLTIERGGIYALLGPNGAGKTTLLKLLAGLLLPNQGAIEIDGRDLSGQPRQLRDLVGLAVCDERSFYWRLSGRENLRFFASLNGLTGAARDRRVAACLELVDLEAAADHRYMEYSSGMRQRLALARGLLLDPAMLLMDEPTRSLDPEATVNIHEVITGILARDPDRVFLYSTHDLAEAESISSDVIVLRAGRIVTQQSLADDDAHAAHVYCVRTHPPVPEATLLAIEGVTVLGSHGDETTIQFADLRVLDAVLDHLRGSHLRVLGLTEKRSGLGEIYHASAEARQ